jgi:ribosomal-protein-alanine N-acetyltransferase
MDCNITIRPATKTDLPDIINIELDSFTDPWPEQLFMESFNDKTGQFLCACAEHGICGYIVMHYAADEADINNVCVKKEYRNKGIGRQLIATALDLLTGKSINKIFLEVRPTNTDAIRLYESFGFIKFGLRRNYYPNGGDAVLMKLDR